MRAGTAGYEVTGLGLNYRPTEISSALGRVQLGKVAGDRERRRKLVATYRAMLGDRYGMVIPFAGSQAESAYHLMAILLPAGADRETIRSDLADAGIQTSVHYPPTHGFSFYRHTYASGRRALPVTEAVAPRLLSLPLHSRMSRGDAALVCQTLVASVRARRAVNAHGNPGPDHAQPLTNGCGR